jgi:hypothetical protein
MCGRDANAESLITAECKSSVSSSLFVGCNERASVRSRTCRQLRNQCTKQTSQSKSLDQLSDCAVELGATVLLDDLILTLCCYLVSAVSVVRAMLSGNRSQAVFAVFLVVISTLKMEAACSETLASTYKGTRHNPEDKQPSP